MRLKPTTDATLLMATLCASCEPTGRAGIEYCATAKPILIGSGDVLTDEMAREITDADQTGHDVGGWIEG